MFSMLFSNTALYVNILLNSIVGKDLFLSHENRRYLKNEKKPLSIEINNNSGLTKEIRKHT